MKKILFQTSYESYANNVMFTRKEDINNSSGRWTLLKSKLSELGYEIMTADNNSLEDCEGIIFFDSLSLDYYPDTKTKIKNFIKKLTGLKIAPVYPTRKLYKEAVEAGLRSKMVLLLWEAQATFPLNFSPKTWEKFDHILTWDASLIKKDPKKFNILHLPMEPNPPLPKPVPFNEKKLLVNICHNKYYSSDKNELYKERRKINDYYEKNYPNDFDLYGFRWNVPATRLQRIFPFLTKKYTTYRGFTQNKIETLSKYKFSLAYENIAGTQGYIADRIFSSFQSRSVPIYWGPDNVTDYIDPDTFIDRRKFKNNDELASFLTRMTEADYNKYLEAADRYMKSEKYAKFLPENFCNEIIAALGIKPL